MAIFPVVCLIALVIIAGSALASCTSGGGMGDYIPQWAGGLPNNAPPRPGTPEYEAYRQKLEAEAARDKSKDPPKASQTYLKFAGHSSGASLLVG